MNQAITEYLDIHGGEVRERLASICRVIEEEVPLAEGRISYNMPAYFYHGSLVYFCAFKRHIGFYPASSAVFLEFQEELASFKQSGRGTVQFQYKEAFPLELIRKMVAFRARENEART